MQIIVNGLRRDELLAILARLRHDLIRKNGPVAALQCERLDSLSEIAESEPEAWSRIDAILEKVDHRRPFERAEQAVTHWAAAFDAAAGISPEASVALHSLGDPARLAAATKDVVGRMREWRLLERNRVALEIGCGTGRFLEALAGEVRLVLGIDIAPVMLRIAQRRCANVPNAYAVLSSGKDLSFIRTGSVDLVLAIDSFPYLVLSGGDLAARHLCEAARVLSQGGQLLILNFSYRGDLDRDRREIALFARDNGLHVLRSGTREFSLWDGVGFQLRKMV